MAYADRYVAEAPDLDVVGKIPDAWRGPMSLRWVLVHLVEEYARHLGHADLLREQIDGRVTGRLTRGGRVRTLTATTASHGGGGSPVRFRR